MGSVDSASSETKERLLSPDALVDIIYLCHAVSMGNLAEIDELLQAGVPIDGDMDQHIPLMSAFIFHNSRSFFHLLSAGASINFRLFGYNLAEAVALGPAWPVDVKCVALDLLATRGLQLLSLHWAAVKGDVQTLKAEIEEQWLHKDAQGNSVISYLFACGHLTLIRELKQFSPFVYAQKNFQGSTPLLFASENGHLSVLKWFLESMPQVADDKYVSGNVFSMAARNGHLEIVKWLLSTGRAKITDRTQDGSTPFLAAASSGPLGFETMKWLVEEGGASVLEQDADAYTAAIHAARNGHLENLQWLIEHGGQDSHCNKSLLVCAASNGHLDIVQWLLEHGSKITEIYDGDTALLRAASNGKFKVVKWLLEKGGASIKERDPDGATSLLLAAWNGYFRVVKFLLVQGGANILETANDGSDALSCSVTSGNADLVRWLLQEFPTKFVATSAVLVAARHGHLEVLKCLKHAGASVLEANEEGITPVMLAASEGHLDVVKWLVCNAKADVSQMDDSGDSVIFHAVTGGKLEVVRWLLCEGNSKVSERDENDCTVILRSVADIEILRYLLENWGLDAAKQRDDGITLLMLGAAIEEVASVKYLLRHGGSQLTEKAHDGSTAMTFAMSRGSAHVVTCLIVDFEAANPEELKQYAEIASGDCADFCNNSTFAQAVCLQYHIKQRLLMNQFAIEDILYVMLPSVIRDLIKEYLEKTDDELTKLHANIIAKYTSLTTIAQSTLQHTWIHLWACLKDLLYAIATHVPHDMLVLQDVISRHMSLNNALISGSILQTILNEILSEIVCYLGQS